MQCNQTFSPRTYLSNDSDRITNTKLWLGRTLLRFQYTEEESDMCKGELLEITETLRHECENKMIVGAWCICGSNLEWQTSWPNLMQLWQRIILIPSCIAICERGLSKQNAIKSHLRNRLDLKILDALMRISFLGLKRMQQIGLPSSIFRETCKTEGYLRSNDSFFLKKNWWWCLQIKIIF